MNYLCQNKKLEEMTEDEIHVELKKAWLMLNAMAGSIYKDAVWDDLRELAVACKCEDNEVKLGMKELVRVQSHNFY